MIGRAGAEAIADQPVFPTEKAEIAVRDDQVAEARHRADGAVAIEDLGHPLHVRLEANRLAVAAALDPHALRRVVRHSEPPCPAGSRSEEHTSELQSLMRISYAVFCLKKK